MLASISAGSPLPKGSAALGFKIAYFHASSIFLEKRADKFGSCNRDSHKEYHNYVKRKKRAAGKRECAYWQSCEFHVYNFEELYWSRGVNGRRLQKQRGPDRHNFFMEFSDYDVRYGYKKKRKSGQQASRKGDRCQSMWQSFHTQWWGDFFHEGFAFGYGSPFTTGKSTGRTSASGSSFDEDDPGKSKGKCEAQTIGSPSDRQKLGLSPSGSLTIEELKKAFRASALKWHPDRHDHAAKARAEAKFKDCGAAYRSLLNALAKSG